MKYIMFNREATCENEYAKKETISRSNFCEECHSEIEGKWSFYEKNVVFYKSFYDTRKKSIKENNFRIAYDDFVNADNDYEIVDLNSVILGIKKTNVDIYNKEQMKKMMSFCLRNKIRYNKDAFYEYFCDYDEESEKNDKEKFTSDYFDSRYVESIYVSDYGERLFCYLDTWYFDNYDKYFESDEYKDILRFKEEITSFEKMNSCPICGGKISLKPISKNVKMNIANDEAATFTTNLINNNTFCSNDCSSDINISDTESLKKYLKQLLVVETTILEVSTRLKTLYAQRVLAAQELLSAEKVHTFKRRQDYDNLKKEYETIVCTEFVPSITIDSIPLKLPPKPIQPQIPVQPILKTPGFFNKKKVIAENELLTKKYEVELELYSKESEKYSEEMLSYSNKVDELKKDQKEKYEAEVLKEQEQHNEKLKLLRKQLDDERDKFENETDKAIEIPEKKTFDLIDSETNEAIKILEKASQLRYNLYSSEIVFEKYRDIVAIATFYEYLSSGRCQELGGADGAYNLYENEIRMNMVVSQLSQVLDSLEQIKQNQYVICTTIQEMNNKLSSLDASMEKALSVISKMEVSLSNIDNNTEVIAYNTEVTAFYAKKNAELTNALGYMVALS